MLGSAFSFVRSDIVGNVEKLETKSAEHKMEILEQMVEFELTQSKSVWGYKNSAFTALLWLKRGLEYLSALLRNMAARPDEELSPCVKTAYDETLAKYHGWPTRQIFKVAFAAVPYRKDVEVHMGTDRAQILQDASALVATLEPYLQQFNALYAKHNLLDHT